MDTIVRKTIKQYNLCPKNSQLTLGISGGADSIAMLHFFHTYKKEYNITLQVVHIHHGIRGEEADLDCTFVTDFCNERQIPCKVFHFDVTARAKKEKKNIEEMGRILRYQAFKEVAKGGNIAVAHNEDDQAETVLMHLSRGSGLKGLCGMEVQNDNIIRPLLHVSRKEIEGYCQTNHLHYRTDSTNNSAIYNRNRMRLEVLPLLAEIYGDRVKNHIAKTTALLQADNDFLNTATKELYAAALTDAREDALSFSLAVLRNAHTAILHRFYFHVLHFLGAKTNISSRHIEMISDLVSDTKMKEVHLPNDIHVKTSYSTLFFQKNTIKFDDFYYDLSMQESVFVKECNIFIEISVISTKNHEIISSDYTKVFDYDKIKETICCRNRKTGDTIGIFRDKNSKELAQKSLKKDFIDRKIPKDQRDTIPLVACGSDILWAVGIATSKKYEVTTTTSNYLRIKLRRATDERTSGSHVDSRTNL